MFYFKNAWKCGYCSRIGVGVNVWQTHHQQHVNNRVCMFKMKLEELDDKLRNNTKERQVLLEELLQLKLT